MGFDGFGSEELIFSSIVGFVRFEVRDHIGPARGFCATASTPPEPLTGTHRPEMSCHSSAGFRLMCLKTLDPRLCIRQVAPGIIGMPMPGFIAGRVSRCASFNWLRRK